MTTVLQWLRSHSSAILVTAVAASNAHLLPKVVGELASAIAAACGVQ
jgi:hypothetical protein